MKAQRLRWALRDMASHPDVLGCALVNQDDGMTWHVEGRVIALDSVASSSSDYWRLHRRTQNNFDVLGDLWVIVLMHREGQIVVSECGNGMLLVMVTSRMGGVDWNHWKIEHHRLAALVNEM